MRNARDTEGEEQDGAGRGNGGHGGVDCVSLLWCGGGAGAGSGRRFGAALCGGLRGVLSPLAPDGAVGLLGGRAGGGPDRGGRVGTSGGHSEAVIARTP